MSKLNIREPISNFVSKLGNHTVAGFRILLKKRNRRKIYLGLVGTTIGAYCYQQFIGNNLEVIYTPNDYNNALLKSIDSISCGKYYGSPLLFIRCMEIIYGNTMDTRAYTEYQREIVYAPDSENLALGILTRLENLRQGRE